MKIPPRVTGSGRWQILPALLVVLVALFCGGCVTSKKYKMAKKEGALPPATLNWVGSEGATDVSLQSVIVFKGPGSWKREARWDEYVLAITNRGTDALVIDEAGLVDLLGQTQSSGVDPWKLEKLSYTNWDKYGKTGLKIVAGAGAVALYGAATVAVSFGGFMAGPASTAAAGGGVAVLNIIPIVAVVDITAVAIMNNQNKKKVVTEFNRRRLPMPLTVAAGENVTGSFFFPMTPGPQKLLLRGRQGGQPVELVIELKPLAGLHLKPVAGKK